jgi:hypothetical protein
LVQVLGGCQFGGLTWPFYLDEAFSNHLYILFPFQADELTKEDFKGSKVRHLTFSSLINSTHHFGFLVLIFYLSFLGFHDGSVFHNSI